MHVDAAPRAWLSTTIGKRSERQMQFARRTLEPITAVALLRRSRRVIAGVCLLTLPMLPAVVEAQSLADVKPGTLVRLTLRGRRARLVAPLAGSLADSIQLSSTPDQAGITIPVTHILHAEYADTTTRSHTGRGLLIGGAIGAGIGYAVTRGPGNGDDESMFINGRAIFSAFTLVGTLLGGIAGAHHAPVRWIATSAGTDTRGAWRPFTTPRSIGVSKSF